MSKVRVPIFGTVGKSVRVNPDASFGAQLGVDLFDERGYILTLASLSARVAKTLGLGTTNDVIFEEQIVEGTLLARVADDENITGQWDFWNTVRIGDSLQTDYLSLAHDGTDFTFDFVNTTNANLLGASNLVINAEANVETSLIIGEATALRGSSQTAKLYLYGEQAGVIAAGTLGYNGLTLAMNTTGGDLEFNIAGGDVIFNDGADMRFYSVGNTDASEFISNTVAFRISNLVGHSRVEFANYSFVYVRDAAQLRVYDAADTDYIGLSHDGANGDFDFVNTADVNFAGITGNYTFDSSVLIDDATGLQLYSGALLNSFQLNTNNTDAFVATSDLTDLQFTGWTNIEMRGGADLYVYDAGDTDFIAFSHDGTDANFNFGNTTDLNNIGADFYKFDDDVVVNGGGIRATGVVSNDGIDDQIAFMDVSGSNARFGSFNFSTGSWQPARVQGSEVQLLGNAGGFVKVLDGSILRIEDGSQADFADFQHDGADLNLDFTNTLEFNINDVPLHLAQGSLFLTEKAAADADVAARYQLWAKNTTPNELWGTNDVGTDKRLDYHQLTLPFHSNASTFVTLTNQANAEQFFANNNRNIQKVDLTHYTQVRLIARVTTASASVNSPRVYIEYSTTFTTTVASYLGIGSSAVQCSLSATGVIDSGWINLVAGAKADVFVSVLQNGGDGAADPVLGHVVAHFR